MDQADQADQAERNVSGKIMAYMLALQQWQESQGVDRDVDDPMTGKWALSGGGLLEFSSGIFRWYRHGDDLSGDCRSGRYSLTPGILTNSGFILDRGKESTGCFSVYLDYTLDRMGGREKEVDFRGLLFVEQMGSADEAEIYNHRTDARYRATRIDG